MQFETYKAIMDNKLFENEEENENEEKEENSSNASSLKLIY